jgi:hypothetical protein
MEVEGCLDWEGGRWQLTLWTEYFWAKVESEWVHPFRIVGIGSESEEKDGNEEYGFS